MIDIMSMIAHNAQNLSQYIAIKENIAQDAKENTDQKANDNRHNNVNDQNAPKKNDKILKM